MKAKIQEAIKSARDKNKGKIAPSKDIYEAIYTAGWEQGWNDNKPYLPDANEPWDREQTVFNDGKQAGIKEVTEWMLEPCPHAPKNFPSDKRMCVQCCEAKLKEWE